ncbi:hypothetical protein ABIF97_006979 [Bradyrhizobium japonicum]
MKLTQLEGDPAVLGDHGLYTFFAADDDRTYEGYYRSDRMFKDRSYLDTLHEL